MSRAQRHPFSCGTTVKPVTAASSHPSAQNDSSATMMRPRRHAGAYSLTRVEATGDSAPSPRPTMKRSAHSTRKPGASADNPVATP